METYSKAENSLIGRPLEEITDLLQLDYRCLDVDIARKLEEKLIIGTRTSAVLEAYPSEVRLVEPPKIMGIFTFIPIVSDMLRSLWLLGSADQRTCILIDGGHRSGILTCILNSLMPIRKRKIVLWEAYIPSGKLKRWLARHMILGASITIVQSCKQLNIQSKLLDAPKTKFMHMPYKANDSKSPPETVRIGGYVFSGGTSRRDYETLFDAVRHTEIPIIVSAGNPSVFAALDIPENVILLAGRIPRLAFARLMAASAFVVMPIETGLVRGAGEGTIIDAMWHGKAVICADDISAFEYIQEGITGYATPPGDAVALRERIMQLWEQPKKAAAMGRAAHQAVVNNYTYEHFNRRLRMLGYIIASSK